MRVRAVPFALLFGVEIVTVHTRAALAQTQGPLVICTSQQFPVSVTPDGTTRSWTQYTISHPDTFTVKNTSLDCSATYNLSHTETGPILGVSLNKSTVTLSPGASTKVVATYDVGSPGTGVLTLKAVAQLDPNFWDTGYFTVTAVTGAPTNWDISPLNHDNQIIGRCAAACFAASYAQSTVPYFSLDMPRGVTLAYNGDRVWPKPFIHLNVQKPSGSTPDTIFLQVKKAGVWQTFINGDSLLKFLATPSGWQRIAAQLRDSTWATGMYTVDLVVTWHYPSGSPTVQTWTTKLMVVNETNSAIARGWIVGGMQRAYTQSDSSVLITEGDGSVVFFRKRGATTFFTPAGEFSTLSVNGTGWKRVYSDSTKVLFNSAGRPSDVYDRFNNRTQFFYDGSNRLTTIRDPNSQDLVLAYGSYGLSSIRDNILPYRYTNVTAPSDSTLSAIQDPDGLSSVFQYDASRRLWRIINRRGDTTTVSYQLINGKSSGKLATITSPAVQIYGEGTVSPVTTLAPWQTVGVLYSSQPGQVVIPDTVYGRITDPGGHVTRFTVNRWGTPTSAVDPLGRTDSTVFDANGLPIRHRSRTGAVDSAVFNDFGLPVYAKSSGQTAMRMRYAGWAQVDSTWTDDGLHGQRYFIGASGRVDSVRIRGGTADVAKTRYRYDSRGRVDSVVDPLQHTQRTWYAGTNGNRSKDSLPGGRVATYAYDSYGRDTAVSQPGFATVRTFYSIMNRTDSIRDGVNPVPTRFGYDAMFVSSVTDPKGQVVGYTHNGLGWLTRQTDPVSHDDVYEYSRDGELRRWTNRRGQSIDYGYDVLHRRTSKSGTNTATESWAYPNDTVVVATSPVSVDTVLANRYSQVLRVTSVMGGQAYVRRYTYGAGVRLDSVIPSGGGITFQARKYIWNVGRGWLNEIKLGAAPTTVIAQSVEGMPQGMTLPGGDAVSYSTNSLHETATISTTAAYSATVNRSSGYDPANRLQRHITSPTMGHQYYYDALGRLIADSSLQSDGTPLCDPHNPPNENGDPCTFDPGWTLHGGPTFSYDSAGNRRDLGGDYSWGNRITAFNGCTYASDFDGNVTSRTCGAQVVTFAWTAENRLASTTVNGQTTTLDYNAAGRLVRKSKAGSVRYFLWDRDNLLAELDSVGPALIAEYSYYPGLDNLHAIIVGGTKYYAHKDGVGNVIALTDSVGTVKRWYDYTAWGTYWNGSDPGGLADRDRPRFKGGVWMGDVGGGDLYYLRNRWYEPQSGRFLSEDPAGLAGGVNPYVFTSDDPVNQADPTGMVKICMIEGLLVYWHYSDGHDEIISNVVHVTCSEEAGGQGGSGQSRSRRGPRPGICRAQTLAGPITIDASVSPNAVEFINTAIGAGAKFSVNNGFRTTDEQTGLWLEMVFGLRNGPVAEPFTSFCVDTRGASNCGSFHEAGFSIDVNWGSMDDQSRTILQTLAPAFGFKQNLAQSDPIHFQWNRGFGPYGSKENAIVFNQAISEHFPVAACQ